MDRPVQPTPKTAPATRCRSAKRGTESTVGAAPRGTGFVANVSIFHFIHTCIYNTDSVRANNQLHNYLPLLQSLLTAEGLSRRIGEWWFNGTKNLLLSNCFHISILLIIKGWKIWLKVKFPEKTFMTNFFLKSLTLNYNWRAKATTNLLNPSPSQNWTFHWDHWIALLQHLLRVKLPNRRVVHSVHVQGQLKHMPGMSFSVVANYHNRPLLTHVRLPLDSYFCSSQPYPI